MEGVKTYVKDDTKYVSLKGTVIEVTEYNKKSIRFVAETNTELGTIAGFRATSIEEKINVGDELTFSTELGYLTGETSDNGESANFLWSTSRGSADDITDDLLAALKDL